MKQARLIVFTRYPESGKTKTRMIPVLGPEGAAQLQRQLTEKTLKTVSELDLDTLSVAIYFSGGNLTLMQTWLGNAWNYYPQSSGDLGDKLQGSVTDSFKEAIAKVVIIGTDCPHLTSTILNQAFASLDQHHLVIGPAVDGGYYLIGLSHPVPQIFENIAWGTEKVLKQTQEIASKFNLNVSYLPTLRDLDRPEDLDLLNS